VDFESSASANSATPGASRVRHFCYDFVGRNHFGQIRTLELRNSARFVQTARFAISPLTRSVTHVCGGIAQSCENFKVGSIPVARSSQGTSLDFRLMVNYPVCETS